MCPLPLCCSNGSQKCEWKIINTEGKQRKKKHLNLKTQYWFPEFPYKRNIHNSCDLPKFCYNYLLNPQILKDARLTFLSADSHNAF